jgi:hypothetical protein
MFAEAGAAIAYTKPSVYFFDNIFNKQIDLKRCLNDYKVQEDSMQFYFTSRRRVECAGIRVESSRSSPVGLKPCAAALYLK